MGIAEQFAFHAGVIRQHGLAIEVVQQGKEAVLGAFVFAQFVVTPAVLVQRLVIEFIALAPFDDVSVGFFCVFVVAFGEQHFAASELGFQCPLAVGVLLYQRIQAAAGLVQIPIHGVGLGEQIVGFGTFVGIVGAVEQLLIQLDRRAVVHILVGERGGHGACQVQQG